MIVTDLNISIGLIDLARESPGLVGSRKVLWQRVQLPGFVIIHPLGLLLHWLGSLRFMNLQISLLLL